MRYPAMPSEFHNRESPLPFRISVIFCISYERKHVSDLSMLVFCFRGHTFVDNVIYELQKSTTIAFSRNSLYTFYSRNPTCGIHQCLRISNRKYPPMPSEFHNREPPLPFGNPKSRPWYGMDIFWNHPFWENICSEDDLRSRIFRTFVAKFLACLPVPGFSNI